MKMYANLHTHSTHSDGVHSPEMMVKVAKEEGFSAIAISDHDAGTAYSELKAACEKEGMRCIFAVEFSVNRPVAAHIVAFDFDPEYPPMKKYLADMGYRQTDNTKKCFDEGVAAGGITGITWEEVEEYNKGIIWLCNNHVFRAMQAKGLVKEEEYMAWYMKNYSKQRGHYPPIIDFMETDKLIALVKEAGGFCVIAHPSDDQMDRIDEYIAMGIEGIEVWHSDLNEAQRARALAIALDKDLYISGGSDHSGLLGGLYPSYPTEEALKASPHYIPERSTGVPQGFFEELVSRHRVSRKEREEWIAQ